MPQKTCDIVLSSPFSNYDFFAHQMRELCGQMDLTFFLADEVWVHEFLGKLRAKDIAVWAMLDLTANQTDPDDVYTQLAYEVTRQKASSSMILHSPPSPRTRGICTGYWCRTTFPFRRPSSCRAARLRDSRSRGKSEIKWVCPSWSSRHGAIPASA